MDIIRGNPYIGRAATVEWRQQNKQPEPDPIAAETLLLTAARAAATDTTEPDYPFPDYEKYMAIEEHYGVADIRMRLGEAYPRLSVPQELAALEAFDQQYVQLPLAQAEHHHHAHHAEKCDHMHGPVRRFVETIERAMLGRIRNHRVRLVAALAFRASSLVICPGDDIAAIGLQAYRAFHGGTQHGTHEEQYAVLPRRSSIHFKTNTATIILPIDTPLRHADLPPTPEGQFVRSHIRDL